MSATDQEEIIEQLRALLAGRGDGISLDTPFHWAIDVQWWLALAADSDR